MELVTEERQERRALDDLSGVHHDRPVGGGRHDSPVMGDQEDGDAGGGLQREEQLEDLALDRDVQRRRRFVGDEDFRIAGEGTCDGHALRHPARQLVGEPAHHGLGVLDTHLLQQLHCPLPGGGPCHVGVQPDHGAEGLPDRAARVEAEYGVL